MQRILISDKTVEKSNELLVLIHSNICDFKSTPSRGGNNYYISLIDEYSKFFFVYLINSKDEALNMFKKFKAQVENQLDTRIEVLRLDRGGVVENTHQMNFLNFVQYKELIIH